LSVSVGVRVGRTGPDLQVGLLTAYSGVATLPVPMAPHRTIGDDDLSQSASLRRAAMAASCSAHYLHGGTVHTLRRCSPMRAMTDGPAATATVFLPTTSLVSPGMQSPRRSGGRLDPTYQPAVVRRPRQCRLETSIVDQRPVDRQVCQGRQL
jgi:hypothetical protein